MDSHLSQEVLQDLAGHRLRAADLLTADQHLEECEQCRIAFDRILPIASMAKEFRSTLEGDAEEIHLQYEELAAYVDGRKDSIDWEIAEIHLRGCDHCKSDVAELRALDIVETGTDWTTIPIAQPEPSWADQIRAAFGMRAIQFGLPVILLAGLTGGLVWLILSDRSELPDIAVVDDRTPVSDITLDPVDQTDLKDDNVGQKDPAVVSLRIADGLGEIKLSQDGKLIDSYANDYDSRISAALRFGELKVANEAVRMRADTGILMSSQGEASGLRVNAPVGKVLTTNHPEFVWSTIQGADSYTVEIFDTNFNKVASSPTVTSGNWRSTSPLPRGREYTWQVTAVSDGEIFKAPARPAPDARFFIISSTKLQEIERAKRSYGRSNLVMGIVYADAGLIIEAEREFQSLLRKNPGSDAAQRLLSRIRAAR